MSFVRFGSRFFTKKRITVGYLVRYSSRLKIKTVNDVFLLQCDRRFPVKTRKRYDFSYGAAVFGSKPKSWKCGKVTKR